MANKASLFRKAALDHLASPEQLDQLLQVGSMRSWIALLALLGTVATALIWGFAGRIDTDVTGQGVLVRRGGVRSVVSMGEGVVTALPVAVGQTLVPGAIVATLREPVLDDQIDAARSDIAQIESQLASLHSLHKSGTGLEMSFYEEKQHSLEREIGNLETEAADLRNRVATGKELLAKGLVTRQEHTAMELRLAAIATAQQQRQAQLTELSGERFRTQSAGTPEEIQLNGRLAAARMRVEALRRQLDLQTTVRSPYAGRVVELKAHPGALLAAGQPVLSLQPEAGGLDALVYVPAEKAKQIVLGMPVQISPTELQREEYGYIRGTVTAFSAYPATQAGLMDTFANPSLVAALMAAGPVVEVRVAMEPDGRAAGGWRLPLVLPAGGRRAAGARHHDRLGHRGARTIARQPHRALHPQEAGTALSNGELAEDESRRALAKAPSSPPSRAFGAADGGGGVRRGLAGHDSGLSRKV